jgi:hypothetical protein
MSVRFNLFMSETQHDLLVAEANRTGLAASELVRRAIDRTYRPDHRARADGFELSLALWRRPDAAVTGRRPGIRLVD